VKGAAVVVGRARELARLRAALVGDPRLLLVVGDAGSARRGWWPRGCGWPQPTGWWRCRAGAHRWRTSCLP